MPATRLLVIADSKMLPALANGLRDGPRFDVLTVPLSDAAGAQAAAQKAEAVLVFYGAPGAPLAAALQTIAPKLRDRGVRLVAVLQREQAALRDECFRAGASDLLFMPMPKDQFMSRLLSALDLPWAAEGGPVAQVSVATRTAVSKMDQATISAAGVEAPIELPLKTGETVRLSWGAFQSWGLVVRGGPSAQIRFAGLAPDEEAQIRDWLQGGGQPAPAPDATTPGAGPVPTPPAVPPAPAMPVADAGSVRAAPSAGPPPGFADRKPVRPYVRAPVKGAPPVMTAAGAAAAGTPGSTAPVPGAASAAAEAALSGLFDGGPAVSGAGTAPGAAAPAPAGPPWPVPASLAACKSVALQLLKDKTTPADTPAGLAAAARKITGGLGSAERAALDKGGPDSHLTGSLAARIALETATAEGVKLFSESPAATVDAAAVAALMKLSDDAAAQLQKEANVAVSKGEVESLQMITAASAALSRDHLRFKETADRLRGLSAAPRLGAGALDPDIVLPGQAPRPAPSKPAATAQVRAELRDFKGLEGGPSRTKNIFMIIAMVAFAAALANALYFSLPHQRDLTPEAAGPGVERIDVHGEAALVTISQDWLSHAETGLHPLTSLLRENGIKKAVLILANGSPAGTVDVVTGQASGLSKPKVAAPPK